MLDNHLSIGVRNITDLLNQHDALAAISFTGLSDKGLLFLAGKEVLFKEIALLGKVVGLRNEIVVFFRIEALGSAQKGLKWLLIGEEGATHIAIEPALSGLHESSIGLVQLSPVPVNVALARSIGLLPPVLLYH